MDRWPRVRLRKQQQLPLAGHPYGTHILSVLRVVAPILMLVSAGKSRRSERLDIFLALHKGPESDPVYSGFKAHLLFTVLHGPLNIPR